MASGYRGGILGASGTTVGFKLPSVDGVTLHCLQVKLLVNTLVMALSMMQAFAASYVKEPTQTNICWWWNDFGDISIGVEQVTYEDDDLLQTKERQKRLA